MRTVSVGLAAMLCLGLATSANAERRMFIVANDSDGYGIDRCLASGEKCGEAAANAYCKTQAFAEASTSTRSIATTLPAARLRATRRAARIIPATSSQSFAHGDRVTA
ncbi:MAG: hypothetical protein WB691_10010 [Pseudolabrys sp.]